MRKVGQEKWGLKSGVQSWAIKVGQEKLGHKVGREKWGKEKSGVGKVRREKSGEKRKVGLET